MSSIDRHLGCAPSAQK